MVPFLTEWMALTAQKSEKNGKAQPLTVYYSINRLNGASKKFKTSKHFLKK